SYMLVMGPRGGGWDVASWSGGDSSGGAAPRATRKGGVLAARSAPAAGPPVPSGTVRAAIKRARRSLFQTTVASMVSSRAIAFDDQAQDFLDNLELKRVLADIRRGLGRRIDVLGFDACLMSMVEVAYQLRDSVSFICGSEEEEPGEGWPYDTILKALTARPSMTPAELAKLIVSRYMASYQPRDRVTLSASSLGSIGPLADAVNRLGRVLLPLTRDGRARTAVIAARSPGP